MQPSMTGLPPLNLSSTTASHSGDIGAPNTVHFGSTGGGGSFDLLALVQQYWPMLAVAGVAVLLLRR